MRSDCLRSAINYYRCAFQYPDTKRKVGKCEPKTLILWGNADKYLITEGAQLSAQVGTYLRYCSSTTLARYNTVKQKKSLNENDSIFHI